MGRIIWDEGRPEMYSKTKERVHERGGNERIPSYRRKPPLPQVLRVYQVNTRGGSSKLCGRNEKEDEAITPKRSRMGGRGSS